MGIHISLTSNLHWPAQVRALDLAPQQGYRLQSQQITRSLLPLTVQPGSTACLFSFLVPSAERREGPLMRSGPSRLCTAEASEQGASALASL